MDANKYFVGFTSKSGIETIEFDRQKYRPNCIIRFGDLGMTVDERD